MKKIFARLRLLVKRYQKLRTQIKNIPAYEICGVDTKNIVQKILVKINGTGKIVSFFPEEIVTEGLFLEQFSPKDICTITSIYYEGKKKARYKIISQKFSSDGKNIFCLKDNLSTKIQEIMLIDISQEFIKQCSPEDAFKLGYHAGSNQKN